MTISNASKSLLQTVFGSKAQSATIETRNGAVYYAVGLMKAGMTRKNENVERVYCLVFDDVGTKVDRDLVETMMPKKTYSIESSPGNFQYGWAIDGGCSVEDFAVLRDGAAHRFGAVEARAPSNLVRLCEGVNGKPGPNQNWAVKLVEFSPGLRYTQAELLKYVGAGAPRRAPSSSSQGPQRAPSLEALRDLLSSMPNDRGYDYDYWIRVGIAIYGASGGEEWGRASWILWSEQQPPGDFTAADKWETFSGTTSAGWGALEIMAKERVGAAGVFEDDAGPVGATVVVPLDAEQQRIAAHIVTTQGDVMKWNVSQKKWMVFSGDIWETVEYDAGFWAAAEWAKKTQAKGAKSVDFPSGVSRYLRNTPGMLVTDGDFNKGAWIAGVPGGTLNLRAGVLVPAKASDMISKRFSAVPDGRVPIPHWLRFLGEATQGDSGMADFLQRWAGYCLTGDVRMHKFVYLWGPGGNGKSLFVETLKRMMGDYGVQAASDLFVKKTQKGHPDALARLAGARLVVVPEISGGDKWDVDLLKEVTGNELMVARYMYGANFTFPVTFKIMSTGNHQPAFPGGINPAIERRFIYGKFENVPRAMDIGLAEKFTPEMPGIMAWALDGLLKGFKSAGLAVPKSMSDAAQEYFDETDPVLRWKGERLQEESGVKTPVEELFKDWDTWAMINNVHDWRAFNPFAKMLRNKGLFKIATLKGKSTVYHWKIKNINPF